MASNTDFHILALSGGGFRGLYTATVLAALEDTLGAPLAKRFDLICGTSVGGILALGLSKEIPSQNLKNLFLHHGREIFDRRSVLCGYAIFARHTNAGLKRVLTKEFQDATIGDLSHPVLIPTVNFATGLAKVFKTPHHEKFETDYKMSLVDAALATSAAPTYFPIYATPRGKFVDGGLVANAPGLLGLHEAVKYFGVEEKYIRVLSIGTMSAGTTIRGNSALDLGFMRWRSRLFDLMISAQESITDNMLRHRLGERYFLIDDAVQPDQAKDISVLDKVNKRAIDTLTTRGTDRIQMVLGNPGFHPFRQHHAAPPIFFHGRKKNT
jgi:patatin-like phospholipase/acyl hydrolase